MRILLFGKNGQVGWELQRMLAPLGEIVAVDQPEIDFMDLKQLRDFTFETKPDLIVNAAAYTAVDRAESEPEIAMRINGEAPGILAEVAKDLNAELVHYSTDYVFDGTKREPYSEEDEPNPLGVYGESKLAGDRAIEAVDGAYIILRTSWVYGSRGSNFYLTILRLANEREELRIVDDQVGCPTWCRSIAEVTADILTKATERHLGSIHSLFEEISGVYNYSSSGEVSWCDFAKSILENHPDRGTFKTQSVIPISSEEYPTSTSRPAYSVLLKERIQHTFGLAVTSWEEQLQGCLEVPLQIPTGDQG